MSTQEHEAAEKITAAAILQDGVVYTGPHHATIIHYVARCVGITPVTGEQGFITSKGRFARRKAALLIAIRAGQLDPSHEAVGGLFSEMLWSVPEDDWIAAALADAVRVVMADAREALQFYGRHTRGTDGCKWLDRGPCTCGLEAAIVAAGWREEGDATAKPMQFGDGCADRHTLVGPCKFRKGGVMPATHRCKVCGAHWRLNEPTKERPEGSWSLVSTSCGKCCDNVAMGDQIERLEGDATPGPEPAINCGCVYHRGALRATPPKKGRER